MLKTRQVIPPLTARAADGRAVRAWDYKQKKNLVIVFLNPGERGAEEYLRRLAARAAELREREAVALVVLAEAAPAQWTEALPAEIVVATDMSGRAQRAFLGEEALGPQGLGRAGVFVTDRYGELHAQWTAGDASGLPGMGDVLGWLAQIQVACEECGVSDWPAE